MLPMPECGVFSEQGLLASQPDRRVPAWSDGKPDLLVQDAYRITAHHSAKPKDVWQVSFTAYLNKKGQPQAMDLKAQWAGFLGLGICTSDRPCVCDFVQRCGAGMLIRPSGTALLVSWSLRLSRISQHLKD